MRGEGKVVEGRGRLRLLIWDSRDRRIRRTGLAPSQELAQHCKSAVQQID